MAKIFLIEDVMHKQISQHANGNVQNMVAGDQYNYYGIDLAKANADRRKMRTALLQYRDGRLPEFHNLLCDYAKQHFGNGKISELNDEQLGKLYRYHQTILIISQRLATQARPRFHLVNWLVALFKRKPK